jgi:hypothetical protein
MTANETYLWPRPWTAPAPSGVRWASTPEHDRAVGVHSHGYGPRNAVAVTHERRIVFVKSCPHQA